jgi:hypothetical protein
MPTIALELLAVWPPQVCDTRTSSLQHFVDPIQIVVDSICEEK